MAAPRKAAPKSSAKKKVIKKATPPLTTYLPLATCGRADSSSSSLPSKAAEGSNPSQYLALALPLPPDVDGLLERGSTVSASSYTSQATPQSSIESIDTPQTGSRPSQGAKKSKPSGPAKAVPKRKGTPAKQQQDEVMSDKQLVKEGLKREKEAKRAAMRKHTEPPLWDSLMPADPPASPRRRAKQTSPTLTTSKDAEMALLLGLAGMKPKPRSCGLIDEKAFVQRAPAAPPLVD